MGLTGLKYLTMTKSVHIYCYDDLGEIVNKVVLEFSKPVDLAEEVLEDVDIILYEAFGPLFETVDIEVEYLD